MSENTNAELSRLITYIETKNIEKKWGTRTRRNRPFRYELRYELNVKKVVHAASFFSSTNFYENRKCLSAILSSFSSNSDFPGIMNSSCI